MSCYLASSCQIMCGCNRSEKDHTQNALGHFGVHFGETVDLFLCMATMLMFAFVWEYIHEIFRLCTVIA